MSMNFGREQALLRQRLTAQGTEELIAARVAQFGDSLKFLGADDQEVVQAATDLAEAYPDMGRAQMTAFVRTLWSSKTHELRCVGIEILAMRASLLEPPDLPFVEGLLKETTIEQVANRIACDVLGPLVCKNKKLWKDLKKLSKSANERLRRAAVRATKAPIAADSSVFSRFEDLVTPLLSQADALLQQAIDEVLIAAAAHDADLVNAFAKEHGRELKQH
jgi:3-methyladenine DNA glycosylase AlkD